jgi:hypothetical protein
MRATAATLLLLLPAAAQAVADPVVVELFTSQGCSACPPADEIVAELQDEDDVIALALHVDYWDWIGWEDTFGHSAHTEKQKGYAARSGSNMVYTPQFVLNGSEAMGAPSAMELLKAIDRHRDATPDMLDLDGDRLRVAAGEGEADLWLLSVLPRAGVHITHGENAGHERDYHGVVLGVDHLARWEGEPMKLDLPAPPDGLTHVVIAQETTPEGHPGAIRGAARRD